jgi:hypothetical protein
MFGGYRCCDPVRQGIPFPPNATTPHGPGALSGNGVQRPADLRGTLRRPEGGCVGRLAHRRRLGLAAAAHCRESSCRGGAAVGIPSTAVSMTPTQGCAWPPVPTALARQPRIPAERRGRVDACQETAAGWRPFCAARRASAARRPAPAPAAVLDDRSRYAAVCDGVMNSQLWPRVLSPEPNTCATPRRSSLAFAARQPSTKPSL